MTSTSFAFCLIVATTVFATLESSDAFSVSVIAHVFFSGKPFVETPLSTSFRNSKRFIFRVAVRVNGSVRTI
jgi:hypothetical protein